MKEEYNSNQLFKLVQNGNLEIRNQIIMNNFGLVVNAVNKYFFEYPFEPNELIQIGLVGLIKSVDTFDYTKNFKFSTYATRCIINEINMFLRKEKNNINNFSYNNGIKFIKINDDNDKELLETIEDPEGFIEEILEEKELQNGLKKALSSLSEKEAFIIKMRFGFGGINPVSLYELANILGVSQSYTSRIINKIIKKLRQEITQSKEDKNIKSSQFRVHKR